MRNTTNLSESAHSAWKDRFINLLNPRSVANNVRFVITNDLDADHKGVVCVSCAAESD